jgi:threonine dehydrogenase-like Zn-dependent dehydrogenase
VSLRRTGQLFVLPVGEDDALMPWLLTLSDVMGTGHHAAVAAEVGSGATVAVVGDGAVAEGYRAMNDREAIKVMVRP